IFFFSSRRRHTRFSRDWSSDVCSSDLPVRETDHEANRVALVPVGEALAGRKIHDAVNLAFQAPKLSQQLILFGLGGGGLQLEQEIGRASCRERAEVAEGHGVQKKATWY